MFWLCSGFVLILKMNLNQKFLCHKNEDTLQPINSQFSGIFKSSSRIFTQENLGLLNRNNRKSPKSPQLSESSNSTIDYEFLTPHTKTKVVRHHFTSSPNKDLNLEFMGPSFGNLDTKQIDILKKVSKNVPADGNISFKT